jgi:hypothetical protein
MMLTGESRRTVFAVDSGNLRELLKATLKYDFCRR